MNLAKTGILGASDITTSCPSKDNASSGDGGGLTLVSAEKGSDGEKRGAMSLPE